MYKFKEKAIYVVFLNLNGQSIPVKYFESQESANLFAERKNEQMKRQGMYEYEHVVSTQSLILES